MLHMPCAMHLILCVLLLGSLAVSRGFGDSELKEKKSLPAEEQMVTGTFVNS